jgi:tRNA A-37 threonylcarbamoyl transferase component Bud32
MSLEGQQLGEFEIIERIGRGGMGAVYKARQTSLDRIVALKTLQSSLADNTDYIARFRQEAKAAAGLNHPNLVQVISAGESEGLHWFAMEYVEGESAKVRLRREGRLKPLAAIVIATHVATALEYGWRKAALIHRDIKPDNIFLSGDGEVKLGDLGLAKSAGQAQSLTTTGAWMGTPHYMSPEQARAMKDVDLRADIYSLGCTLYHLLCGQPPYVGNSSAAVLMKHMSAPAPDLRRAWTECPPLLAAAVGKMMRKRPADRQQSYEEVIADLRRACGALSGTRVPSVIPATQMPAARGAKRGALVRAWLGGGVAVIAAIAALILFAPWKEGSTIGTPKPAVSQTTGGKAGRQKMDAGASLAVAATPASKRTVVVATTPPPAATPVPTTPAPTSTTPAPSTPTPSTPKPATEVEKWFAQVDGPQQAAFQKQVLKPFEAGLTDLLARYRASLDAGIAKASAAGQLADALAWRTERRAFEKAQNVASDDDTTPIGVKTLRAAFRQQLAELDQDRIAQATALHAAYDAILAKNQTLLTKHQHLDDALLLQTKRDEIARAWLGPSPLIGGGDAGQPEPVQASVPLWATKDTPFVNTLGMRFVPVPILGGPTTGQRVLFSVWDTRVEDYEAFVKETKREWPPPVFEQGPTHPAVNVSWEDAQLFCRWLTARDQAEGRLPAEWNYRLPSDHEWICAVELRVREDGAKLWSEKNSKISDEFPWGTQWPPPKGAGNYAGEEMRAVLAVRKYPGYLHGVLAGYNDGFAYTSPVGSFSVNGFGLYDMGGNVWQWCEDWFDASHKDRVMRGASWIDNDRGFLLSSFRSRNLPGTRLSNGGFRCVAGLSAR